MKRILLLLGASIKFSPYVGKYLEILKNKNCEITLVYWNRSGMFESNECGIEIRQFLRQLDNDTIPLLKVTAFLEYRIYIKKILKEKQWDRIIVFTTPLAILVGDLLVKKYKEKYVIDYRDQSILENYFFTRERLKKIIINSIVTSISSAAYAKTLPYTEKLILNHNYVKENSVGIFEKESSNIIRFVFWGCVRDYEVNRKLIKGLANDGRFEIHYYGKYDGEGKKIKKFCKENAVNNVYFHGEYQIGERKIIAARTELIHNLYSNIGNVGNPSMGNKFYDGLMFGIPQVCLKGGFMGEIVEKNRVGITIDFTENFPDRLYQYYNNINWNDFRIQCKKTLEKIQSEEDIFIEKMEKILLG